MSKKPTDVLRVVLFAVALVFIIVGLLRGEAGAVLTRAVNICLECIGIG